MKPNHSAKGSEQFQNLNLLQKFKTYEMYQMFRDHGPKLFKEFNLAEGNGGGGGGAANKI